MKRLAVLTNLLSPASAPAYDELAARVPDLAVFLTGHEENRQWEMGQDWRFQTIRPRGRVIRRNLKGPGSRRFDTTYLHVPTGLLSALRRFEPDAVISSEMGLRSLCAWTYCRKRHLPFCVHWEGTVHNQINRAGCVKRWLRRHLFIRMPQSWVACGQDSKQYLVELGVDPKRIWSTGYAVHARFFDRTHKPGLALEPKPVLLVVARQVRLKGLRELLQAVSKVQCGGARFTTLLVGEGDERPVLEALVRDLGITDVVFHPPVPPDTLPGIYASADVMLFPSLSDGWGIVIGEALAMGLPVLSSIYAGATAELVPPAWRFDPTDPAQFAEGLHKAMAAGRSGRSDFPEADTLPTAASVARTILEALTQAENMSAAVD